MKVAEDFKFSQNNLQDFTDCRRRFWYKYEQKLSWPALEAEPAIENERFMRAGSAFHQLVHQYIIGIPADKIEAVIAEDRLLPKWWQNFIGNIPFDENETLFPEQMLMTRLTGKLVVAKYDLIVQHKDGQITIYDWKTSKRHPGRERLASRMQTKVYPFVLANGANKLSPDQSISPEKIQMVYWFSNHPDDPEIFQYSQEQFEKDKTEISTLLDEITGLAGADAFPLTLNLSHCKFCRYRSLCDRGVEACDLDEMAFFDEPADAFDIDFNETAPIEY
ncbi:MAG TPA: PD-(D/E)XK nuclease family protein [Anaerolineales bacterium]|nr:PD-(D/E)XK nuclease family protein [Anaerolineales bacterium]